MKYEVISTGSKGNAVLVADCVLCDCGVSFKALSGIISRIKLVLITHRHGDHLRASTLRKIAEHRPGVRFVAPVYLLPLLLDADVPERRIDIAEIGCTLEWPAAGLAVEPFPLFHDVPNVGYKISAGGERAIYATDTVSLSGIEAPNFDLYLIECNYTDEDIKERISRKTEAGEYIYEYRVMGTHLSKERCDEFLRRSIGDNSEIVYLHRHSERNGHNHEN